MNCTDARSRACPPFLALPRLRTHPFPPRYPDCHLLSSARSCWPCDLRRGSFCPRPLTAHPTWPSWGSRRQLGPCPLCVLCLPRSVLRVPCRGSSSPFCPSGCHSRCHFPKPLPCSPTPPPGPLAQPVIGNLACSSALPQPGSGSEGPRSWTHMPCGRPFC